MAKRKQEATPEKPTKKPSKTSPVSGMLVSICILSNLISGKNARNLEQITNIAYQIAKAATIYTIGEIIVLDVPEQQEVEKTDDVVAVGNGKLKFNFEDEAKPAEVQEKPATLEDNAYLLATLLQYFVTPPYLVKTVFGLTGHKDILQKFKYAAKLPKITTLPFMGNNEVYKDFKEGITIPKETAKVYNKAKGKKVKSEHKISVTRYVNIGEAQPLELQIKREVPVNSRVTVDVKNKTIVPPETAYGVAGNKSSFGYYIRMCKKISNVFAESSVEEGYSLSLYVNCDDYYNHNEKDVDYKKIPAVQDLNDEQKKHALMFFGNYKDLQRCFEKEKADLEGVESVGEMFDGRVEVPAGLRVEDAVLIGLTKVVR